MLNFIIGLPGFFSEWCENVIAELCRPGPDPVEHLQANTARELVLGLLQWRATNGVVIACQPSGNLLDVLSANNRRFIVALDSPRDALAQLVMSKNMELLSAIQSVASGCGAVMPYVSAPEALVLTARDVSADVVGAVSMIRKHLNISFPNRGVADIASCFSTRNWDVEMARTRQWWNDLDGEDRKIAEDAIGGYDGSFFFGKMSALKWAPSLFRSGDRPQERLSGPIDITGRSRSLFFGPQILVPRGDWLLAFKLVFSEAALGHDFSIEVSAGQPLASSVVSPWREGEYQGHLTFTVGDAVDQPLEVRMEMRRAAFDGTLLLKEMIISRRNVT